MIFFDITFFMKNFDMLYYTGQDELTGFSSFSVFLREKETSETAVKAKDQSPFDSASVSIKQKHEVEILCSSFILLL